MGMDLDSGGGKGKVKPEMNVAPLVDIVLVLLIIFMVIAPVVTKGMYVILPPKPEEDAKPPPSSQVPNTVTMTITNDGRVLLNRQHEYESLDAASEVLAEDLKLMLNDTPSRKLYVNAEDEVDYGAVVRAMDLAKPANPNSITLLTEPMKL